jgi:peptide subunit release factor 1 (eRF1)
MKETARQARRLLERTGEHPVVSVYFDLDPDEFATAPARATQARSLLDEAERLTRADDSLDHQDRVTLTADLERLEAYLQSDDLPVSGVRALAIFCSGQDDLFETVRLPHPAAPRVVIARTPYLEPLAVGLDEGRWSVALVSRHAGRIFDGAEDGVREREDIGGKLPGEHHNHERSYDNEADAHLRDVAHELYRDWQRHPFQRLFIGGPAEIVERFAQLLHNDLRPALSSSRVDLDVTSASETDVRGAVEPLLERERSAAERQALEELKTRLATQGAATTGLEATLQALTERRVQTLLLSGDFHGQGGRCRNDGLLTAERDGNCPADGSELEPVSDLREAAVESALLQDAEILVVDEPPGELRRGRGIAALLRF